MGVGQLVPYPWGFDVGWPQVFNYCPSKLQSQASIVKSINQHHSPPPPSEKKRALQFCRTIEHGTAVRS